MSGLLTAAELEQTHLFFGLLYEAVVKVPDRLASDPDLDLRGGLSPRSLLRPGNPTLYFVPGAPLALGAPLATLIVGWTSPTEHRTWLTAAAAGSTVTGLLTAYIVRQLNMPLFFDTNQRVGAEREALLRRWHRLNYGRLAMIGMTWLAVRRARNHPRRQA